LKYWSVDLQEAYALPSAVLQRHYPGKSSSCDMRLPIAAHGRSDSSGTTAAPVHHRMQA
jgi:hypothetical protein